MSSMEGEGGCRVEWSLSSSHMAIPLTVTALRM